MIPLCSLWFALLNEIECEWLEVAATWATTFASNQAELIAALKVATQRGSASAALELVGLSPDSPGLVDALANALSYEWVVGYNPRTDETIGGAGLAAQALHGLRPEARRALPHLRNAILSKRCDYHSDADRKHAFATFVEICGEASEMRELLAAMRDHDTSISEILVLNDV